MDASTFDVRHENGAAAPSFPKAALASRRPGPHLRPMLKPARFAPLIAALLLAGPASAKAPANAIHVIAPYKHHGTWVFDDPGRGLGREAFVSGADDWMERMAASVPGGAQGFTLIFSAKPFPGAQRRLQYRRAAMGGAWYYDPELKLEGWLCSTLFRYFDAPPREIYAQVKPKA
ncbi:MAG TPA: DUF6717 family protein [Caulobacteraceae bacterium]